MATYRKWQHMVLEVRADQTEFTQSRLDGFGSAGWEVVGVCACVTTQFIYLKREVGHAPSSWPQDQPQAPTYTAGGTPTS